MSDDEDERRRSPSPPSTRPVVGLSGSLAPRAPAQKYPVLSTSGRPYRIGHPVAPAGYVEPQPHTDDEYSSSSFHALTHGTTSSDFDSISTFPSASAFGDLTGPTSDGYDITSALAASYITEPTSGSGSEKLEAWKVATGQVASLDEPVKPVTAVLQSTTDIVTDPLSLAVIPSKETMQQALEWHDTLHRWCKQCDADEARRVLAIMTAAGSGNATRLDDVQKGYASLSRPSKSQIEQTKLARALLCCWIHWLHHSLEGFTCDWCPALGIVDITEPQRCDVGGVGRYPPGCPHYAAFQSALADATAYIETPGAIVDESFRKLYDAARVVATDVAPE